ncbi:MAG TPA: hypothetical protein VIF84_02385, partial [Candidatus Limnocylindrales bacterium]
MPLRRRLAILAASLLVLGLPAVALAHPLGNFTINHYTGLHVMADRIAVDQVFDLAEIPAFQALQATDGGFGPAGAAGYAMARCAELAPLLSLRVDGARLPLTIEAALASLPAGQGGLPTLRLECGYVALPATSLAAATRISFADGTYAERIGWREMVVTGDGLRIEGADGLAASLSARLTRYPDDLLAQPPSTASIDVIARPDGGSLATGPETGPVPEVGVAVVPGGVDALPAELTSLFDRGATTPTVVLIGLLVAVALGAFHALTPGHGKTIMAAYLVGTRGDVPRALGLGATVAVSHTLGVLLLALVVLGASSVLPAERLFPILSVVSGALVAGLGAWLLVAALRQLHRRRTDARAHAAAHAHGHHHDHGDGLHDVTPTDATHADSDGWHEHGGVRHTHLPAARDGQPIRWLGIVTLGLAGGMIPSASAILLLLAAVAAGQPELGVLLVVAFGVGMAGVLGGIGLLLVGARGAL